jgi:hypothetical protein
MIYAGIDPSFTKTGVCYLDTKAKTITFNAISPAGINENYKATLDRAGLIVLGILKSLDMKQNSVFITEEPLLTSIKASRLGILSGVITWSLAFMPSIKQIYSVTPTYISSTNSKIAKKHNLNKKQASMFVASQILEYLESKHGYEIKILNDKYNKDGTVKARKLSHDESEAFILTLLLMLETNALEDDVMQKMYDVNEKFRKKQHISLLKGELNERRSTG